MIRVYENKNNYRELRDKAIEVGTIKYLILLKLIHKLYQNNNAMEQNANQFDEPKTLEFFSEFGFNESKRAMFYLGKLIRRVAEAQKNQNHGHKPVLGKINYNGMKLPEIKRLSVDIIDKLRQYNSKKYQAFNFGEEDLRKFEYYFCKTENKWDLTETETVFYLFSGYGMYWETIEPKEKQQLKDVGIKEGSSEEFITDGSEIEKS